MDSSYKQYAKRTYGDADAPLNDYDMKLVKSLEKYKSTHAAEIAKRRCIVFLEKAPSTSLFEKKQNKNETIKDKKESITKTCSATTMTGKPCTAKAKNGEEFCGRHLRKVK
jgi:hypothetical protein